MEGFDDARRQAAALLDGAIDLSGAMPAVQRILEGSIRANFAAGGRFGNANEFGGGAEKWLPSEDAKQGKHRTLGNLDDSIRVTITGPDSLAVTSDHPGAAVHQFGGDTGRGHAVHLDARPFVVVQNEDLDGFRDAIVGHLSSGF